MLFGKFSIVHLTGILLIPTTKSTPKSKIDEYVQRVN
jgi:hypothetical protein